MRKKYGFFIFLACFLAILTCLLVLACSDTIGHPKNMRVYYNDDYSETLHDGNFLSDAKITGIDVIKQKISCGYAIIEMLAKWQNKKITEDTLSVQNNGEISTAMGSGFLNEMARQFPEWKITRCVNQTNTEMLEKIHISLANGFPVPVEFAAKDTSDNWTLHFGLVTAMNLGNNEIVVQNPYGYEETYTAQRFIAATRYETYENMEWYFKIGFTMGIFNKNTFYIIADK
ncbi:MAG: hypothetical protein LBK61_12945 [Spirochaetaceae bacterium]|jgi:hypothetical protein|nr:hypothetical protein [Spirochaetaceae bacterium]